LLHSARQEPDVRRQQYACDIITARTAEFGFDYLRDNGMATTREQQVQRGLSLSMSMKVDAILITKPPHR